MSDKVYFGFKEFSDFTAKGGRDIYAVTGNPVRHSMSPALHGLLVTDCKYYAVEVREQELSEFCNFARRRLKGFNITVPFKKEIIKYLDEIDITAAEIGSVNTVSVRDGKLFGSNTDIYGLRLALTEYIPQLLNKNALVLGAGGVALAAVFALTKEGAKVTVAARDTKKAKKSIPNTNIIDLKDIKAGYDVIINCTPCGMKGQEETSAIDISNIKCGFLFDTVYNPLKTKIIKDAENSGILCANGLSMLIHQAVKAQEIWGNRTVFDIDEVKNRLVFEILKQRLESKNKKGIALCGFMGSGKSSAAALMEELYGFKNIDTDKLIERKQGISIPSIFEKYGENRFRDIESEVLKTIDYGVFPVISLGGGSVIRQENVNAIKKDNILVYIEAELETVLKRAKEGNGRPLLNKPLNEVKELYLKRKTIYDSVCDIKADGNGSIEKTVNGIIYNI